MTHIAVREISIAVVKGTRLLHPEAVDVERDGVVDDRRFFLVGPDGRRLDATLPGLSAIQVEWNRENRALALVLPNGTRVAGTVELGEPASGAIAWDGGRPSPGREVLGPWADALSELLGKRVRLLEATEPAWDVTPVTVVSDASVRRLEEVMGTPSLGSRRFRMTLTLAGARAHEEDEWEGREARIGTCVLRMRGPVPRCVTVTRDPDTGRRDHPTLRGIVSYRDDVAQRTGPPVRAPFGVYAEVVEPGRIAVGDAVRLGSPSVA